jgi:hypothetical protein
MNWSKAHDWRTNGDWRRERRPRHHVRGSAAQGDDGTPPDQYSSKESARGR